MSIFLVIFCFLFHPLHLIHVRKISVIGITTFLVMYANVVLLRRMFPQVFDALNWTIGKYILFTLWQCFVLGIFASIAIHAMQIYPEQSLWDTMKNFYLKTLTYGGMCIVLVTFVVRNAMLRSNLRQAIHANTELEKIRSLKQSQQQSLANAITIHSDTSETLNISLPDLLYIEAEDNYSTFYFRHGEHLGKRLLRVNLKNVETQLNNAYIIRCHRSFMVNINAIAHVRGNTNGYKLTVHHTDAIIPVSRSKGPEVIEKIEQIRNFTEVN